MKKRFGWFTGGGFEKDPSLTEADKRYYRKKLVAGEKKDKWEWDWFFEKSDRVRKDDWL